MNQVVELKAAYQQLDALKRDMDTTNAEMQRLRRLVPIVRALGSPLFRGSAASTSAVGSTPLLFTRFLLSLPLIASHERASRVSCVLVVLAC